MRQTDVTGIVERLAAEVRERYVFPDVAEAIATLLADRLAAGAYAAATDLTALCELVTADLQAVNNDRHLRLKHHEIEIDEHAADAAEADLRRQADASLNGVTRVEHLDGGAVHVELRPLLFPPEWAAHAVIAAMNLAAPATALFLDVRHTVGGDPRMVALLCSYLFDEPTHLTTIVERGGDDARQSWTLPYVPGPRFGASKPVYVLTSAATFSGGEELAYDLQQLGRATVVGERTGGGAHPRIGVRLHPHLEATIPVARPVHPVSGGDWEGVGVRPDVEVKAEDALAAAHRLATNGKPVAA
ncbi:S41 family peptidase [Plantactinospora sp. GCM10030261]|uniref:S41 family peptidase n=1 Tax=Plantactinospora sp. GCM10030261 TaxID=3273420 RepID=UPI00360E0301